MDETAIAQMKKILMTDFLMRRRCIAAAHEMQQGLLSGIGYQQ